MNFPTFARTIIKTILRPIFGAMFRIDASGLHPENTPDKLLIIANHESFLDGFLLGLYLPNDTVFVVHTGVTKNWLFKIVLSLVDYLPVDPISPMAMKKVIKLIEQGKQVVIFPEGRITTTGSLMKVYDGPAFVAAKTGASILPVRLDGASRTYFSRISGAHPQRFFPKISIVGLPLTSIPLSSASSAKLRRKSAGDSLRKIMQNMIFASQPKTTLYSSLIDIAMLYGRRRTVVEDIKQIEYTYNNLIKMTLALGTMVAKESEASECVGILMPNLAATVCMMIGTSAQGRIPAMLNYKSGTDGMQNACIAANIKTIFTSRDFIEKAKLQSDVDGLKGLNILYLEDLKQQFNLFDKIWTLFGMVFPRTMERPTKPEDTAVVLFTSGSEGKPKGVALSHQALLSNIAQIRSIIEFSPDDKVLNALPIFHSFGLTGGALLPILTGMKLFLYATPLHYRIIPEIAYDRSCTVLFGTNTFLANYAKHANPYDFFKLRYVVAGAEKLTKPVTELWFEKFGIRILEGYGATETAPVLAVNTPMAFKSGTVGHLLPGIEYQLVPVPGIENGGMLHVKGPNVMSGYYRFENPGVLQPPSSELGDGWYETGDVVIISPEGFISIVGRVKRFAKIAGEMVSLEVVEKIAITNNPSAQHAAIAIADPSKGEALVLFTTDVLLTRNSMVETANSLGISELSVPKLFIFLESIPLLGTGKTDYVSLNKHPELP